MNRKFYWVLRKTIQIIFFWIKKNIYRLIDNTSGLSEYKSFRRMIIKYSTMEISKGLILSVVVMGVDHLILNKRFLPAVDDTVFVPFLIGCIGIVGVILGLKRWCLSP